VSTIRLAAIALVAVLCGCAGGSTASIALECADFASCPAGGTLGVGGRLFYTLYGGGELVARDDSVLRIDKSDVAAVVGVAPGTTDVMSIGDDGRVLATAAITVAAVTELLLAADPANAADGPLLDHQFDAAYAISAAQPIGLGLQPLIGSDRSMGTHYYDVSLDGKPYDCTGDAPRYCTGPVYYDQIVLDPPLPTGDHVLALHSTDGGRDFAFRLSAN
jgi:hypothetical protein